MTTRTEWILQRFAEKTDDGKHTQSIGSHNGMQQSGETGSKKYSDEDLNRIISRKFAEWAKKKDEEMNEATRLANMNAQERAEHERDQLKQQLQELQKRDTLAQMTSEARSMLQTAGVTVPESVISMLVDADADKTKKVVGDFIVAFKAAVQSGVVEQLKGKPPRTGGVKPITKAEIMAVKSRAERQRLILEHQDLF